MKKQNLILSTALAAIFSASTAFAEAEVTGKIVHESAKYTNEGASIGSYTDGRVAINHGTDAMKAETSARIYFDGEADKLTDGATYHVELNLMTDSKGIGKHDGNEAYTQRDPLREAYIDAEVGDWSIRTGKQQVVWGTADGMKLLDMINPTDYSEMAQNQMEDSRIPVWMINAEKDNLQVIISQPKENIFAGLDRNISTAARQNNQATDITKALGQDQGHAFIMKGVDSITGKHNGFLNIVPDLGSVATSFFGEFSKTGAESLQGFGGMTVSQFAAMSSAQIAGNPGFASYTTIIGMASNYQFTGAQMLESGFASAYDTNLAKYAETPLTKDSTFEYMGNATFATFDTFVNAKSKYVYNMPSSGDLDLAFRTKESTANGVNYSLNYSYNYDKNPIINMDWVNDSGEKLITTMTASNSIILTDASGGRYGGYGTGGTSQGAATLQFEQMVKRAHNLGGSFDMAIETEELGPVVLRGEALYQKDVYSPVMDLAALSIGDLPTALTMVKGDRFKYVLGVDITALTNMMVSAQFIQDRNLDYIDTTSTVGNNPVTGAKFTSDYSTMSLSNNFNKAQENKEFYSLFLSKPFGASGEHRWNNIYMFEENDGNWNRFDAEFSVNDDTQATVEWNKYWGDVNTQFGQLDKSSNIQVGVKYSF